MLLAGFILIAAPMIPDASEAAADDPKVVFGISTGNAVLGFSSDGEMEYPAPFYYGWCGHHHCHHRCKYVRPPHHKKHHKKGHHKKYKKHHKKHHGYKESKKHRKQHHHHDDD